MPYQESWFEAVTSALLRQGDIFRALVSFTVSPGTVAPPPDLQQGDQANPNYQWNRGDFIILDASCDVDAAGRPRPACEQVLLAQVYPVTDIPGAAADREKTLEVMRKGLVPSRFLLSEFDHMVPPFARSFVEYRHRTLLPHAYLCQHTGAPRLRLKSPFREQFGQWVGACISRVGPENEDQIPPIVPRVFAPHVLRAQED